MGPLVMSIDAGTTGVTVLLVSAEGSPVAKAYREFPQHYPQPGWVEHDPNEIWVAVSDAASEASKDIPSGSLAALGITNQRETTVLWDRRTLQPVHNAIVWQCRRSASICDELRERGLEELIRSRTGLVLDPYFSGTKLTWLMRTRDDLRKRAEAGELAFGTVDSWLMAKLTGGGVHATDATNASRTLLYNIHDLHWDEELLEIMEVPESLLPEVLPSSHRYGVCARDSLSIGPVPISGVAGDQQSALFGQACFEPGAAKNTYGTGSFVLANTGERSAMSRHGLLTTVAWHLDKGATRNVVRSEPAVTYALEGAIFVTGAAVQWLRDGLGIIAQASETEPLALTVPDAGGLHFVPALAGLGAPYWDPGARGAITGITGGTSAAHLARAAVEAMAFQTKDVVDAMVADSGVGLKELKVDGGASVMNLLCQFQADLLGVPVVRPSSTETTAMGAAYLAGIAEGVWSDTDDVARHWKLDRAFEPSRRPDEVGELYEGWKRAVESVRTR
jgi:glycerol kinase